MRRIVRFRRARKADGAGIVVALALIAVVGMAPARAQQVERQRREWVVAVHGGIPFHSSGVQPAHYPELEHLSTADVPGHLRSRVPVFLTGYTGLLDDDRVLPPEQQAERILTEVYGCSAEACSLDYSLQAATYDHLVQGIARAVVLDRLLASGSEQEVVRTLAAASAWSTAERLALIQHVGRTLLRNYDYSYAAQQPEQIVDVIELLRANQDGTPAGICGAIANAQAWMLTELGFADAFVVTSRNVYYPHATVIVRDPHHPGRLLKIDYDAVAEASLASETMALRQPYDESGSYFVYRVNGGLVANLHTELGLLLHTQAGGRPEDLDVLARQTAPAVASLATRKGEAGAGLTAALMSDGSQVVALMAHIRTGRSDGRGIVGEVGGGGTLHGGVLPGYTVPGFYARAGLRYQSPWTRAATVRTRTEASANVSSKLHLFDWRGEPFRNQLNVAQRTRIGEPDGRASADLRIGAQYLFHYHDARDHHDRRFARNYWFVDGHGRHALGRDLEAGIGLGLCIRHQDLGAQLHASLALDRSDRSGGLRLGYRGRTDPDRLSLAPGSTRTFFAAIHREVGVWTWQATYEHSLDGHPPAWRMGAIWRS